MIIITFGASSAYADNTNQALGNGWEIVKMSGDAWVKTHQPQKIALTKDHKFKKGDQLETGRNGRILLKRNAETIMVMPNSIISLPTQSPGEGKTQILHQVGEILLDVEKRNVKHFEVNTPYLSAVVKGTQFRVSVDDKGTNVDVLRGKVEVSNFQTGRFVLVKPGQSAAVKSLNGGKTHQLQITGKGPKAKIQQGPKRNPTLKPLKNKTPKAQVAKKVSKEKVQKTTKVQAKKSLNTRSKKAAAHVVKSRAKAKRKSKIRKAKAKRRLKIRKAIGVANLNLLKTTNRLSRQKKKGNFRKKSRKQKKNKKITHWAVQSRKISRKVKQRAKKQKVKENNSIIISMGQRKRQRQRQRAKAKARARARARASN